MALIKYGTIITEIKGKIGGQVFQKGKGGFVLRNKGSKKTQRFNPLWNSQKIAFQRAVTVWRKLDQEQRNAWSAITGIWPFTDKFGQTYIGTGFQVFVSAFINRVVDEYCQEHCEDEACTDIYGPCISVQPPWENPAEDPGFDVKDFNTEGNMTVGIDVDIQELQFVQVMATRAFKGSPEPSTLEFKTVSKIWTETEYDWNISGNYVDVFGQFPRGGEYVYFKFVTWRRGFERPQFETIIKKGCMVVEP